MIDVRTSKFLLPGSVYTRAELAAAFHLTDASINNGIFAPHGHTSIWLFVTEDKTPDRVQYADELTSDILKFESQPKGRFDAHLINHQSLGLEILVFHRKSKLEHPGAGFVYQGTFEYISSDSTLPVRFVFARANV